MSENKEQRLAHIEKALIWIAKEQLEQKRIDYHVLRAKLLTE
jgi:hypothetical protein